MIATYESERARFDGKYRNLDKKAREAELEGFITNDPKKISWTRSLKNEFAKDSPLAFDASRLVQSLYRPFSKHWLYFDRKLNEMVYQMPRLFPHGVTGNRAIGVSASASRSGFSVLMTDVVPSLHAADMVGSQFFPLYLYATEGNEPDGDASGKKVRSPGRAAPTRHDAITDEGLERFQRSFSGDTVTKEEVFYYVYGVLHSPDYRERFADNLGKELPRIPQVKTAVDFRAFSEKGRALGDLHVDYEKVAEFSGVVVSEPKKPTSDRKSLYRVEKMRFGKGKDKTVIHYNELITISGIPIEAYEYVVNGKSAIEWVMERQSVATDTASGIVKDANAWATETVGDARYPLSLLLRVISVSVETVKLVRALPALDILDEQDAPTTAPSASSAKTKGRHTLTGDLVIASIKGRRGTFRAQGGFDVTVELPAALDERRRAIEVAPDEDGVVRLRIRGLGTVDPSTGHVSNLVVQDFELVSAVDPNAPSNALFERLATQDPARLLRLLKTGLKPAFLTHAAEIAGRHLSSDIVLDALLELLAHESPLVREGAIYGLSAHVGDRVDAELRKLKENDPSPGVRTAARDALGER